MPRPNLLRASRQWNYRLVVPILKPPIVSFVAGAGNRSRLRVVEGSTLFRGAHGIHIEGAGSSEVDPKGHLCPGAPGAESAGPMKQPLGVGFRFKDWTRRPALRQKWSWRMRVFGIGEDLG